MAATIRVDADLTLSRPGEGADAADEVYATVTASGADVEIYLEHPADVTGLGVLGAETLPALRTLAAEIANLGIVVCLTGPAGEVGRVGAVKSSIIDRQVTGSPHVRLGSVKGVMQVRQGKKERASHPSPLFLPPTTLFPLAPTLERSRRDRPTTTHYTPGSGRPRLIFVVGSDQWDGRPPREFALEAETITIGSSPDADLQLDGLDPMHAEIRHDKDDEYVLFVNDKPAGAIPLLDSDRLDPNAGQILRTGARIELGPWRMGYFREEFADHGRPFGGRLGGELSRQKRQPPRRRN